MPNHAYMVTHFKYGDLMETTHSTLKTWCQHLPMFNDQSKSASEH